MQFQKDKYKNKGRPRKVYIQDNTPDSENGEFINTDPNGNQILSPMYDSQEQIVDYNEPMGDPQKTKSVFQTVRNDLRNNSDMVQLVSDQPIPSLVVNIPSRSGEEPYERSPKTINIGSSRDDYDYNIRTLNARKSPKDMMYQNYRDSNDEYMDQTPYDDDDYQGYQDNPRGPIYSRSRSPQVSQVYRGKNLSPYGRPGMGGVIPLNKMSPSQNYDDLNYSGDKNYDNPNQYNNLKNNLGNNRTINRQYAPEQNQTVKSPTINNYPRDRDDVANKYNNKTYNNMSYRDVKRIANRFSKVYDPNRNSNGLLVEESQITVPGAEDEVFNNRYRVLAKMNRLSNILLAKQKKRASPNRKENIYNTRTYNRDNSYNPNTRKQFNRHTLARSPEDRGTRRAFSRSPDHKFLYVSLAMISSKGPSCEDRPILRRMRLDKGGVVDLAQEDRKKNKFKIKKAERKKGTRRSLYTNPKYRDKAAKVIQAWWRDLKNIYNDRLKKIIKIQSVFRGRFVRKYMYDLFYLNFLYISFCKKIESVLGNHVRPYVWDKLFEKKEPTKKPQEQPKEEPKYEEKEEEKLPEREQLLKNIISRDYRNDLDTIYPVWKKWISNARKLGVQNSKGRNLVQIRADKEKKLGDVRNAFNKWVYVKKILDAQDKLEKNKNDNEDPNKQNKENLEDKENNLKKIKGFFQLINGIEQLTKKEGLNQTLPKLEDYLKSNKGKDKLRKIIARKPNYDKNLLRKYLYKWYGNAMNKKDEKEPEKDNDQDEKMKDLKRQIFKNIIIKIQKKQTKNIIRKYFYKWLKKTIKIAIKEEKDKAKDKEKEYKDKEYEIIEEYEKKITTYETQKKEDDEVTRKIKNSLDKLKKEKKDKEDELKKSLEESKDKKDKDLLNYLNGSEILQRAVWRMTHKDPLEAMKDKIDVDNLKNKLRQLVKIKKLSDDNLLRKYFNRWRNNALKGVDPETLYKLLAKLIEITSNNHKRKILAKKLNKWRRAAGVNPNDSLEKARNISDLIDLLKKIFVQNLGDEFLDRLDKTRNPNRFKNKLMKMYKIRENKDKDLLRKYFDKWRNNVQRENVKLLKSKLIYKIYDKNSTKDKELLNKYFQRWKNKTFKDNLLKYKSDLKKINSKQEDTKRLFVKSLVNGLNKKTNTDLLREYFNRWKKLTDLYKNKDYGINKQRLLLSKLVDKRTNIDYINLLQYLLRWKNKMLEMRAAEAHKPYRKKVIKILLTKNDKEELQRCFTKWKYGGLKKLPIMPYIVAKRFLKKVLTRRAFNEFVKKMTERDPKVLKAKGKDLIRALKDIKDNRIKDFLNKLIRYIQRTYLGQVQPKINDKIRDYYLRKYFNRWVENTLEDAKRKKELLANWIKNKFTQDKLNKDKRKKDLLDKLVNNGEKIRKLNLAYDFHKFRKNARLDEQIEKAKIIQKYCRRIYDKVLKKKLERQKKMVDLMKKLYRKKYLKDLKDIARKLVPLVKEDTRKKKQKLDKLRKAMNNTDKAKNLDLLKKYWDKWKNTRGDLEDSALLLQRKIRQLLAKNKLKSLKRLNEVLLKLMLCNEDKEKDILRSRLNQWLVKAKKLTCDENAKIIQNFCRKKLDNYLKNKLAKYLEQLAKKYSRYLVNNAAKVDKLNKALKHKPFNDMIDAICKRALSNEIKEILLPLLVKYDDKNKNLLLKHYFDKWRKKVNQMKNKEEDAATRLQSNFRGYNFRKYFGLDEKRTKMLIRIIEKLILASDPKNYLRSALAKWRKNVGKIQCHENAKIIQKFCRDIHDKILKKRVKENIENYKNLANVLNKLKVSPQEFIDRLKEIRRNQILDELLNKLAQKRLNKLKDAFDNIKNYPKYKYLDKILPITDEFKDRILRKYLNLWRNKAMRYKGIMDLLRSIFNTYDDFKNNLLRYNLMRWRYKAKFLTQKEQERIISEFCKPILKNKNAIRNWHKLADALRNKKKDKELEDIYNKLRNLIGIQRMKKPILHNARKSVLDKLNKNRFMKQFLNKIRPYFDKNDEFWKKNLLKEYFDKWRDNARKMKEREDALNKMMSLLVKLNLKKDSNDMADASLLKKFLHDYPLIRALGFLRKLKAFARQKGKNENLAQDLIEARKNLEPQKKNNLIKKLFKVYAYKVLNKLFDNLQKKQEDNAQPLKKEFLDKLYNNLMKQAERSYKDKKESETTPKNKKTSFRLKKPTLLKSDQKKKLIYVSLLPSLFRYINDKILRQKEECFYAIKKKSDADKFCELYKKWAEKQELKPKKELVDKLKRIYKRVTSEGPLLLKLFKLLRREAIRRILKNSKKIRKVMGMIYVTRLLIMERDIAKERFLRQLIRRWRYITFSKKLAMNKMKTIYKNLHMTYLEMANCLFGDEGQNEPSVIKEFERFGTSVGMWENEKPNEKNEEKYVKAIKTQYVFDAEEFEKFQSKYYPTEYEEKEIYEEDKKEVEKKAYKKYYKDPKKK